MSEPLKVGSMVKILDSGYPRARIAEYRGPLGPKGARVYRVLVQKKPRRMYIEVLENQLEVLARRVTPLQQKLEKVLTERFPAPATVKLEDLDGIVGVITSATFAGMETMDRQDMIGGIVESALSQEERRRVQVIVGVTPDEGTGYLASVE